MSDQASIQQSRLAGGLTSIGSQLTQMASTQSEQNVATDIVHEVGQRVDTLGRWLETHGPDELVDEVRDFARRRPVTFLAVAAGAGIVLGRLTRGLKDAPAETPDHAQPTTTQSPPRRRSRRAGTRYVRGAPPFPEERPPVRPDDPLGSPVPSTAGWDQR